LGHSHAAASRYHIESIDPSQENFKTNAFDSTPDIFDNGYFQLFKSVHFVIIIIIIMLNYLYFSQNWKNNWKSVQQSNPSTFNHWELIGGTDLLRFARVVHKLQQVLNVCFHIHCYQTKYGSVLGIRYRHQSCIRPTVWVFSGDHAALQSLATVLRMHSLSRRQHEPSLDLFPHREVC